MAIVINGSGTVTGISVGGLPDGIVDAGTLATNSVDSAELIDGAIDAAHLASGVGGKVVQIVNTQTAAVGSGTTVIPHNDTTPQITEGDEYMTLAITPTSATNKLQIVANVWTNHSVANVITIIALFVGTTADALAATCGALDTSALNVVNTTSLSYTMTSGSTSELTFRLRAGGHGAGTTTFNGFNGGAYFGTATSSSMTITEIAV